MWQYMPMKNYVATCYANVAVGIATMADMCHLNCQWLLHVGCSRWNSHYCVWENYFNLSSGFLNRISSQICSRLYLPMFLIEGWNICYKCIDSLMVLARSWFSLTTMLKVIYRCGVNCDVTMVLYGREDLQMFLEPLSKFFGRLTNILFITFHPVTLVSVYHPHF